MFSLCCFSNEWLIYVETLSNKPKYCYKDFTDQIVMFLTSFAYLIINRHGSFFNLKE